MQCVDRKKQDTILVSTLFVVQIFLYRRRKRHTSVFDHWKCVQLTSLDLRISGVEPLK